MKLSDYVVKCIADAGVKHVFMLPGGGAMHLNDSLGRCKELQYVCCLHEQAAAIAAEGYARITNNLGACMVTCGPGGTNAITGVAGAWLDSTPVIFISGQVKRADMKGDSGVRMKGVQEIDIVSLVKPITKYAVTVMDSETIRYHMEMALYLARTGRRGPVWIDIPLDVQASEIEPEKQQELVETEWALVLGSITKDLSPKVTQAIAMLQAAKRPVILIGNGARSARIVGLTNNLCVPVLKTLLALDLFPDDHPRSVGSPGTLAPRCANLTLQNADLLLILGTRLDMAMVGYDYKNFAPNAKKIMVDIDANELKKMPIDLPIHADVSVFVNELVKRNYISYDIPWTNRVADWKRWYPAILPKHREQQSPVSMYHFSEVLSEEMTESDVIVSGSSGTAVEIFLLCLKIKAGQRCFHNRGTGAMGFGLPAAIGAALASGRRTILVDGDGGFQMNIQELATLSRLRLPVKCFVVNNNGYASIRASQKQHFGRVMADQGNGVLPSLRMQADACGIAYYRIERAGGMREKIQAVLKESTGPVICEVFVLPDEEREPRVVSKQVDGQMVSGKLEDLWPYLPRDEFEANMTN